MKFTAYVWDHEGYPRTIEKASICSAGVIEKMTAGDEVEWFERLWPWHMVRSVTTNEIGTIKSELKQESNGTPKSPS